MCEAWEKFPIGTRIVWKCRLGECPGVVVSAAQRFAADSPEWVVQVRLDDRPMVRIAFVSNLRVLQEDV